MANLISKRKYPWLIRTTEIRYGGGSAVLNNNRLAFYGIHGVAMFIEVMSALASIVIFVHYFTRYRKVQVVESHQIPRAFLFVAAGDIVWCATAFVEHLYVVVVEVLPTKPVSMLLGMAFYATFAWIMHVAFGLYCYLTIVRGFVLKLGKLDWKLHLAVGLIIGMSSSFMFTNQALGFAGYWFLEDASSIAGKFLQGFIALIRGFFVTSVTFDYYSVRKILRGQAGVAAAHRTLNHTELQQLEMFLYGSIIITIPSVVGYSALFFVAAAGYIEPTIVFWEAVVENLSGIGNAVGYFKMVRLPGSKYGHRQGESSGKDKNQYENTK